MDGFDPRLGSPEERRLLATAPVGDGYEPWPDDVVDDPGGGGALRADMVVCRRPEGGAVFAVGSDRLDRMPGRRRRQPVSRVTENALAELARRRPFRGPADG